VPQSRQCQHKRPAAEPLGTPAQCPAWPTSCIQPTTQSLVQNSFQQCSHSTNAACLVLLYGIGSDSTYAVAQVALYMQACFVVTAWHIQVRIRHYSHNSLCMQAHIDVMQVQGLKSALHAPILDSAPSPHNTPMRAAAATKSSVTDLRDAAPATSQQAGRPGGAACTAAFASCLITVPENGLKGWPTVMYTMKMQSCSTRAKAYRRKTSCMHVVAVEHMCNMATKSKVIHLMYHWSFMLASYNKHLSQHTHDRCRCQTGSCTCTASDTASKQNSIADREVVILIRHSLFRCSHAACYNM